MKRKLDCGCVVKIIELKEKELGFPKIDFEPIEKCNNFRKDGLCNF